MKLSKRLRRAWRAFNGLRDCPDRVNGNDHQPHLVYIPGLEHPLLCEGHGVVVEALMDNETYLLWSRKELTGSLYK